MLNRFFSTLCLAPQTQLQEIEKTRTQLEKQRDEEREAIEEKLRLAAQKRDENIKCKLERLKEHVSTKRFFVSFWHHSYRADEKEEEEKKKGLPFY